MGYQAQGSGFIEYESVLQEEQYIAVHKILDEEFDVDGIREMKYGPKVTCFDVSHGGGYYECDLIEVLQRAAKIAPIREGDIRFEGDDGAIWRFFFKEGEWTEQNGNVVFDGETKTALELFIESEIPYRITEILETDADSDAVANAVTYFKENTDIIFDYDAIDETLEKILKEAENGKVFAS